MHTPLQMERTHVRCYESKGLRMNDAELNRILKAAETPQRSKEYWEEFPERVSRLLNRPQPPEHRTVRWLPRLAWAGGFAAVCVLAGFLIGRYSGSKESADANGQVLQSEKLIHEVMAMFPNRVRAIMKDDSGMRLVLSDNADVPTSTPLWVKICQGERCTTLVTFSGQEVMVAGQTMTVLADASGGVILTGDRFAWASDGPKSGTQDLKIQARALQMASR
jgi:hypothetical protein